MTLRLKPIAAAVVAVCFVSAPVLAASHSSASKSRSTFRPKVANRSAGIHFSTGGEEFATRIINVNTTKGGPGISMGRRMQMSGLFNLDGKLSNSAPLSRAGGFEGKATSDIYVNNFNLLLDGVVNPCLSYHVGLAYLDDGYGPLGTNRDGGSVFHRGNITADEAYVTFDDFSRSPFYLRAGKMWADFGQYADPYPLTYSLTQLLEQTRATGVQVGAVTNYGFYASGAVLSDRLSRNTNSTNQGASSTSFANTRLNNFTLKGGYQGELQGYDFNGNVSYMEDARAVDYVEFAEAQTVGLGSFNGMGRHNPAWALHGDVGFGPTVGSNYAHTYNVGGDVVKYVRGLVKGSTNSSRITAWGIDGAYAFRLYQRDSQLKVGFSSTTGTYFTRDPYSAAATAPFLPKWRFLVDYTYHVFPYTSVALEYTHDKSWQRFSNLFATATVLPKGSSNTGAVRLSVAI